MSFTHLNKNAVCIPMERVREHYRVNTKLFGLIKAEEILRTTPLENYLSILCDKVPDHILVNGVKYIKN